MKKKIVAGLAVLALILLLIAIPAFFPSRPAEFLPIEKAFPQPGKIELLGLKLKRLFFKPGRITVRAEIFSPAALQDEAAVQSILQSPPLIAESGRYLWLLSPVAKPRLSRLLGDLSESERISAPSIVRRNPWKVPFSSETPHPWAGQSWTSESV